MNNSSKGLPRDLKFKSVEELEGSPWRVAGQSCCKYCGVFPADCTPWAAEEPCSAKQITAACTFTESFKNPPEENKWLREKKIVISVV